MWESGGGGGGGGIGASALASGLGPVCGWVASKPGGTVRGGGGDEHVFDVGEAGGVAFSCDGGLADVSVGVSTTVSIRDRITLAFFVFDFEANSLLAEVGALGSLSVAGGGEVGDTSLALFPYVSLFVVSVVFAVCCVCSVTYGCLLGSTAIAPASGGAAHSAGLVWSTVSRASSREVLVDVSLLFFSVCVLCSIC